MCPPPARPALNDVLKKDHFSCLRDEFGDGGGAGLVVVVAMVMPGVVVMVVMVIAAVVMMVIMVTFGGGLQYQFRLLSNVWICLHRS
jgi:hypothetical protein